MLATLVESLTHLFAPWQSLFADSKVVDIAVTAVHVLGILVGGGLAIATDRATLRVRPGAAAEQRRVLEDLRTAHRPVLTALAVVFISGLALATSDVKTFGNSPIFLLKLSLVALLCINGAFLYRTEQSLQHNVTAAGWRRLRLASWFSMTLWMCTAVAGVTLVNAA